MEIPEVLAQHDIFDGRQKAVGKILVDRHPALQRFFSGPDARANNNIANVRLQKPDRERNNPGVILIVRMHHDDNPRPALQRQIIASFLIGSIAFVFGMGHHRKTKTLRDCDGIVLAPVITQNNFVRETLRDISNGPFQSFFGIISRHHDDDLFAFMHQPFPFTLSAHAKNIACYDMFGGHVEVRISKKKLDCNQLRKSCHFTGASYNPRTIKVFVEFESESDKPGYLEGEDEEGEEEEDDEAEEDDDEEEEEEAAEAVDGKVEEAPDKDDSDEKGL